MAYCKTRLRFLIEIAAESGTMYYRIKSLIILPMLGFVFALTPAYADQKMEAAIAERVEQNLDGAVELLEKAVNINSGTMNFSGVRSVGELFQASLEELGFATEWLDGAAFDRAGHLFATHQASSSDSPKLLLIGHLDTVFAKDDSFQAFERIDERYVSGPGITDMKGGNVIIIEALRALKQLQLLDRLSIKVILTGDEEKSGKPLSLSKKAIIDAAVWADIALGFEDGDSNIETAVIARRSASSWKLEVSGKPAHSSQIFQPDVGYGAVFETARILNEFREKLANRGDLTFNPGVIVGGTSASHDAGKASGEAFGKTNVIARSTIVAGGIRALTAEELANAKQTMLEIVANNLPNTSATLQFEDGYPPLAPSAGNRALLTLYSDVSQSLGFDKVRAVNPRNAGAADISFTAGHVDMALDGLGLMGRGGHTRDEVADMHTLLQNTQKAAVLLFRLSNP